jgi:hypothetical protein
MAGVVLIAGVVLVVGLLWYVWRHRTGKLARGVGAAGVRYNELYGQGGPPQIVPPAAHGTLAPDEGDSSKGGTIDGSPRRPRPMEWTVGYPAIGR